MEGLPPNQHESVVKHLQDLQETPRPFGAEKLRGRDEYKLRVGNLRIIYGMDDAREEIIVYRIEDRKDVYRRLRRL